MKKNLSLLFIILCIISCTDRPLNNSSEKITLNDSVVVKSKDTLHFLSGLDSSKNISVEKNIIAAGLIDIKTIDTTIVVDLKYSSTDNFLGVDVYNGLKKSYLQPDVAEKLKNAQHILKQKFPFYSLIIYDAVRPRSIQYKMWDTIAVPLNERSKYLSNPKNGSLHNFGAAVDLSIIDENGITLDMGTKYDYFGELAYPREEERMIKEGKLTHIQLLNRELLRGVMMQAGFAGITTEWWHFNSCDRQEAFAKYKIVE